MSLPVLHVCSCGESVTHPQWLRLALVGYDVDAEPGFALEIRTHSCGSARSIRISLHHAIARLASRREELRRDLRKWDEQHARLTAISESQLHAGFNNDDGSKR
jgi:hypothetical protein